jgi:RNA polymerase sigma factor (sigma-70 family)
MPSVPFERVLAEHGPALLRFCVAQAGRERGEDAFQETMLAALRAYDTVRDPAAVRSWLYAIAARKAIDAHRDRARLPEPVAELEPAVVEEAREPADGALWARVRRLPDKQRQAVALRFLADLSHREIAPAMQTSAPAARRTLFEALEPLRADLLATPTGGGTA